jgi:glycosyltransferase involved in cell wall biosynthesis
MLKKCHKMTKKLTVVIPTFNRPKALTRCLTALLEQTNRNFFVVICDNSPPGTNQAIVEHFSLLIDITHHQNKINVGSLANFNNGIKLVKSDYFTLISDDDFLMPNYVDKFNELVTKYPDASVIGQNTACITVGEKVQFLTEKIDFSDFQAFGEPAIFEKMLDCKLPNTWSAFAFKKTLIETKGFIPECCGPYIDNLFVMTMAQDEEIVFSANIGALLVSHTESVSGAGKTVSKDWRLWKTNSLAYASKHRFYGLQNIKKINIAHGSFRHKLLSSITSIEHSGISGFWAVCQRVDFGLAYGAVLMFSFIGLLFRPTLKRLRSAMRAKTERNRKLLQESFLEERKFVERLQAKVAKSQLNV